MQNGKQALAVAAVAATAWWGCGSAPVQQPTSVATVSSGIPIDPEVLVHPEWAKKASIYEVNVRQHTPEGTFNIATVSINFLPISIFDYKPKLLAAQS